MRIAAWGARFERFGEQVVELCGGEVQFVALQDDLGFGVSLRVRSRGRPIDGFELRVHLVARCPDCGLVTARPQIRKQAGLPVPDGDIDALRTARRQVGEDLVYLGCALPSTDAFPGWPDLLGLHRDIVQARAVDAKVQRGAILALVDSQLETFENAQSLLRFLEERIALTATLAGLSAQPGAGIVRGWTSRGTVRTWAS